MVDWEGGIAAALAPYLPAGIGVAEVGAAYIEAEAAVESGPYHPYRKTLALACRRLFEGRGWKLPAGAESVLPESLPRWEPFPETAGALRALRDGGRRIAVLSNVDTDLIAFSIDRIGFRPDLIVTAEECRSYKPAPGHWKLFEAMSGALPERTLHVGASLYHDVAPAAARGYRTVFIDRKGEPLGDLHPTRVLPDLTGLPAAVDALASTPRSG